MSKPDPCGLCKGQKTITRPTKFPQANTVYRAGGLWWITETCDACNGTGIKTQKAPIHE